MPIVTEDIVEIISKSRCRDQVGLNVYHYRCTSHAGGGVTVQDILAVIATQVGSLIKACESSEATYEATYGRQVHPIKGLLAESLNSSGIGGGGAPVLPLQVSGIITKQSAFAGRKFRGRMYVPFPSEVDNVAQGLPSVAYMTQLLALANGLVSVRVVTVGAAASTMTPIIHRRLFPLDGRTIVAARANAKFATQRTRGSYGQPN